MHSDTLIINPTACFSTCVALPVSAQSVFIRCAVLHAVVLFLVPDPLQLAFYSWNNLPLPVFLDVPPFQPDSLHFFLSPRFLFCGVFVKAEM